MSLVKKLIAHPLIRYLAIATGIVILELFAFQLFYIWWGGYVLPTTLSFAIAVVINWALSRKVVFGASKHHPAKEFAYVAIVSIVGLGIQLFVVDVCVNKFHLYPLLAKILSIFASFFWNYWFRAHFIFKQSPPIEEAIEESLY